VYFFGEKKGHVRYQKIKYRLLMEARYLNFKNFHATEKYVEAKQQV
jgi:hypothetical protein